MHVGQDKGYSPPTPHRNPRRDTRYFQRPHSLLQRSLASVLLWQRVANALQHSAHAIPEDTHQSGQHPVKIVICVQKNCKFVKKFCRQVV